ncbi:MAG: hypothetical protein ACUVWA_02555 [Candidatus Oleimicrobiaceae bacterium]
MGGAQEMHWAVPRAARSQKGPCGKCFSHLGIGGGAAYVFMALFGAVHAQQYDFSYFTPLAVGNGPRALAMGGACVATVADGSATSANPAALTRVAGTQALIAGRFTFGALSLQSGSPLPNDVSLEGSLGANLMPELVAVIFPLSSVRRRVTGALAVRSILDLGRSILVSRIVGREQPSQNYRDIEQTSSGGLYALSVAVAAELSSRFAAGMSANFLSGRHRMEWSDRSTQAGVEQEQGWWRHENKFSGFSLEAGASSKVINSLDVGLKLSLPHTLTIVHPSFATRGNESTGADLNLRLPAFFTIGAALRPARRLCLAIDYHLAPWSKATVDSAITLPGLPLPDAHSFHVGMEYLFLAGEWMVPVRIGFHTDPRLEREYAQDEPSQGGEAISGIAFSAGTGLQSSTASFDFSVEVGLCDYTGWNVFVQPAEGWAVRERTFRVIFAAAVKVQ